MNPNEEKKRSFIWTFFEKSTACSAVCKACNSTLKTPSSTTSPLVNHLKSKHHALYLRFLESSVKQKKPKDEDRSQPTLLALNKQKGQLSESVRKQTTMFIARMIALDFQPYDIVENKGFQELIHHLQPQYNIPHRTTFSRTIVPELYKSTVDTLKAEMSADLGTGLESITFTADMWTSRANQGYISLTCHYMTQGFAMKAFTLACTHMPESHTAVNIQSCLTAIVQEWAPNLNSVPVYVVTDNGRNIRAAVRQMEWTPLQCMGHTFQLAIKDAKDETPAVSLLCKKARAIVGHYKHSAQATQRLKDCQRRMELPSTSLIQDVDTRWNSEHAMLSRLVQLKDAVSLEMATSETSVTCLSGSEWNAAESLVQILKPIADATIDLGGQKYGTLSSAIPFLYGAEQILKRYSAIESEVVAFAKNLLKSLKSRFPLYMEQKELVLATLCDPRFKAIFFSTSYDHTRAVELLAAEIADRNRRIDSSQQSSRQELYCQPSTSSKDIPVTVWETVELLASQKSQCNNARPYSQEVEKYFNEPLLPRKDDPLNYWKEHGAALYPGIAKIALRYLPIPATEVPSERMFSTAGNTVTSRRENLKPAHVEQLVFLHDNL